MAVTPPGSPPGPALSTKKSRPLEEDDEPEPIKKTPKLRFGIDPMLVKTNVEKGLDLLMCYGIINDLKKSELLSSIQLKDRTTLLIQEESEKWCADTLKNIVERMIVLSQRRFKFHCPETLPVQVFPRQASKLIDEYTQYLIGTLRECSNASIDDYVLELAPNQDPFLPLRPDPCPKQNQPKVSLDIQAKFQAFYDFFSRRKVLLIYERVVVQPRDPNSEEDEPTVEKPKKPNSNKVIIIPMPIERFTDEIERTIHKLWEREREGIVSLAEGNPALDIGYNLCRLMKKGDFMVEKRKEWLSKHIQGYANKLARACDNVARIDLKCECFQLNSSGDESELPIIKSPIKRGGHPLNNSGKMLLVWIEQLKTQPILVEISAFPMLINKIQHWAGINLTGQKLEAELKACEILTLECSYSGQKRGV